MTWITRCVLLLVAWVLACSAALAQASREGIIVTFCLYVWAALHYGLGAIGLILPRALNIAPVLTPVAAVGCAIVMTGAGDKSLSATLVYGVATSARSCAPAGHRKRSDLVPPIAT